MRAAAHMHEPHRRHLRDEPGAALAREEPATSFVAEYADEARECASVHLAERFADLEEAPAGSLVVLGRSASDSATDYRFDMALRWAALAGVSAVAGFAEDRWRPPVTAVDIASRADLALISVPATGRRAAPPSAHSGLDAKVS